MKLNLIYIKLQQQKSLKKPKNLKFGFFEVLGFF